MPDKRSHRGPHPSDAKLFSRDVVPVLKEAIEDYSLLLSKGYGDKGALKLVGDRFELTDRQRTAVMRSSCSDKQLKERKKKEIKLQDIAGHSIAIDGYNVLITIEAALSGGVLFIGRDGCFRDLASMHGTYRKVEETIPALTIINDFLKENNAGKVLWLLDKPVSNSGRLKTLISKLSKENNWNCEIELTISPDYILIHSDNIVASSDSVVLDGCKRWLNLSRKIIEQKLQDCWLINLS